MSTDGGGGWLEEMLRTLKKRLGWEKIPEEITGSDYVSLSPTAVYDRDGFIWCKGCVS